MHHFFPKPELSHTNQTAPGIEVLKHPMGQTIHIESSLKQASSGVKHLPWTIFQPLIVEPIERFGSHQPVVLEPAVTVRFVLHVEQRGFSLPLVLFKRNNHALGSIFSERRGPLLAHSTVPKHRICQCTICPKGLPPVFLTLVVFRRFSQASFVVKSPLSMRLVVPARSLAEQHPLIAEALPHTRRHALHQTPFTRHGSIRMLERRPNTPFQIWLGPTPNGLSTQYNENEFFKKRRSSGSRHVDGGENSQWTGLGFHNVHGPFTKFRSSC